MCWMTAKIRYRLLDGYRLLATCHIHGKPPKHPKWLRLFGSRFPCWAEYVYRRNPRQLRDFHQDGKAVQHTALLVYMAVNQLFVLNVQIIDALHYKHIDICHCGRTIAPLCWLLDPHR
ncbi:hypothetical protein CGRA01v4_04606 [Colletotrichum graminicola]|nr:hypothetical protein CGRA01v4_04606 [Colletotrichum graminicola]